MRTVLLIFILTVLAGCNQKAKTFNEMMEEVRNDAKVQMKEANEKQLTWARLEDTLEQIQKHNKNSALLFIDTILNTKRFDKDQRSELYFIKGNIYYSIDSLKQAMNYYDLSALVSNRQSPAFLEAKAAVQVKLKEFYDARENLFKAAETNYDFQWNIGNYFEVIGNIDSAKYYYRKLYLEDTSIYKYCKYRIVELDNKKKPFSELKTIKIEKKLLL